RLRSRFEMGLTVDISAPDYETRMAILRKKEELEGFSIDNEVIKYIASNIKTNIREIEGALTKIIAFSKLNKTDITLDVAEEALRDFISPDDKKELTPDYILKVVADHYGITVSDLVSDKRIASLTTARQVAMYLCRSLTNLQLKKIGALLGGRDHATVIHGITKIENELETNPSLASTIDILKKKLSLN
ncbi:MAG: chromosomal replication initiator protein DnaA, partial [Lachnospiraceae bacterium]|nr:chromosomal replication initiator protein DnaA [Lachnospiraceae bacterium]